LTNEALLAEIDDVVIDLAASAVERYRHEIGDLIAQTVAVGIRGDVAPLRAGGGERPAIRPDQRTLVGGLVGLAIYTVSQLLR